MCMSMYTHYIDMIYTYIRVNVHVLPMAMPWDVLQVDGVHLNEALSSCEKGSSWSYVVAMRPGGQKRYQMRSPKFWFMTKQIIMI